MTKAQDQRLHSMKEQAYNKDKDQDQDSRTQRQSNLKKPNVEGFKDLTLGEIVVRAIKDGWGSCRRVIGLDGCFLNATCRGEFLTAMGRDANNEMFPMA
ncbi:hypothetical protein Tco_1457637 [Tanacetum coccineum]